MKIRKYLELLLETNNKWKRFSQPPPSLSEGSFHSFLVEGSITTPTATFEQVVYQNFYEAWGNVGFASLIGGLQEDYFLFWVSIQSAYSGALVERLKQYIENETPRGSCIYHSRSVFKWNQDSENAAPVRLYKFNFFDSIKGLTLHALQDKVIQRVKEVEIIVKEFDNTKK